MTSPDSGRPPRAERAFTSDVVDATIADVAARVADPALRALFIAALPSPLDSTVTFQWIRDRPDTFVSTGHLPAMGLRDSTLQMLPFLRFAPADPDLAKVFVGLINRQSAQILTDPYANLFNYEGSGATLHRDVTDQRPEVFERKWELDSLCFPLLLAHDYWRATGDAAAFDDAWREAVATVLRVLTEQQRFDGPGPYRFRRTSDTPEDIASGDGLGWPGRPNGLVRSLFRPSDDACQLPYNVPANALATVVLRKVAEVLHAVDEDVLAADALELADEIGLALARTAVGKPYEAAEPSLAYEIDGYGSRIYLDDANLPNLTSLPYFGYCTLGDPVYQATRLRVLSADNPWWVHGSQAAGLGSAHSATGTVWPMAVIMQALTSNDDAEIRSCLRALATMGRTSPLLRQAVDGDRPERVLGSWSPTTNSLFGELVLHLLRTRPALVSEPLDTQQEGAIDGPHGSPENADVKRGDPDHLREAVDAHRRPHVG